MAIGLQMLLQKCIHPFNQELVIKHYCVSCTVLGGGGVDESKRQVSALMELIFYFGRKTEKVNIK